MYLCEQRYEDPWLFLDAKKDLRDKKNVRETLF